MVHSCAEGSRRLGSEGLKTPGCEGPAQQRANEWRPLKSLSLSSRHVVFLAGCSALQVQDTKEAAQQMMTNPAWGFSLLTCADQADPFEQHKQRSHSTFLRSLLQE